jgi:hypothetical protein
MAVDIYAPRVGLVPADTDAGRQEVSGIGVGLDPKTVRGDKGSYPRDHRSPGNKRDLRPTSHPRFPSVLVANSAKNVPGVHSPDLLGKHLNTSELGNGV